MSAMLYKMLPVPDTVWVYSRQQSELTAQADLDLQFAYNLYTKDIVLCWGFTAQSTQWGHVERGQFT